MGRRHLSRGTINNICEQLQLSGSVQNLRPEPPHRTSTQNRRVRAAQLPGELKEVLIVEKGRRQEQSRVVGNDIDQVLLNEL